MLRIRLNQLNEAPTIDSLMISCLEITNPENLPNTICDEQGNIIDFYEALFANKVMQSLSNVLINKNTTEVLGFVLLSRLQIPKEDLFQELGRGCLILGCGMADGIDDGLKSNLQNRLIGEVASLIQVSLDDNAKQKFDYYWLISNNEAQARKLKSLYGLSEIKDNNRTILFKKINRGNKINLDFLKYFM